MTAKAKQIGVAVIGAGGRGQGVTLNLLNDSKRQVKVMSVFDPDKAIAESALKNWNDQDIKISDRKSNCFQGRNGITQYSRAKKTSKFRKNRTAFCA